MATHPSRYVCLSSRQRCLKGVFFSDPATMEYVLGEWFPVPNRASSVQHRETHPWCITALAYLNKPDITSMIDVHILPQPHLAANISIGSS